MQKRSLDKIYIIKSRWARACWQGHYRLVLASCLLLGWSFPALAQLSVELQVPASKVLPYEAVIVKVALRNHSGRALLFGSGSNCARLSFMIEKDEGRMVPPLSSAPFLNNLELMPGETGSFEFNLPRLYAIRALGLYKVRAVVEFGAVAYASMPAFLEVARGFELTRLMAGVPDDPGLSRTYVLEYMQKDTAEENLYMRIEDETSHEVHGMFNLGRLVRVHAPSLEVDESGNIHVLFQSPGAGFIHAAFTPYGVALGTENYPGANRQTQMVRLPNGRVVVTSPAVQPANQAAAQPTVIPAAAGPVTKIKQRAGGLFGKRKD